MVESQRGPDGISRRELLRRSALIGAGVPLASVVAAAERGDAATRRAAQGRRGGALTVASAQGIPQLDPMKVVFIYETVMWGLLWNGLTRFTQQGARLRPALAQSWTASRDLKTWTFRLREGVRFSNGKPLTARDVKRSIERIVDPKTGFFLRSLVAVIRTVRVVDRHTVQLRLSSPSASLPVLLSKVQIMDLDALDQVNRRPIGTGPYVVREFVPDDHIVLVPNERYWGPKAPLDRLEIVRAKDPAAAVTSLQAGDFDVVYEVPWQDVQRLDRRADIAVITRRRQPPTALHIMMDVTSPPFDDPRARQAVAYAVNRKAITDALYAGRGLPAHGNVPVPSDSPSYERRLPSYRFDLTKAKRLFDQAGIGERDTLTYWSTNAIAEFTPMGEILQSDLAKIGIRLQVRNQEVGAWVARFAPAGKKWPGLLIPNFYTGLNPPLLLRFWTGFCECNYDSTSFEGLLNRAEASRSARGRDQLYKQAQRVFNRQAPVAVVQLFSVPVAIRSRKARGVWHDPGGNVQFHDLRLVS